MCLPVPVEFRSWAATAVEVRAPAVLAGSGRRDLALRCLPPLQERRFGRVHQILEPPEEQVPALWARLETIVLYEQPRMFLIDHPAQAFAQVVYTAGEL